jgi:hypothetical protein
MARAAHGNARRIERDHAREALRALAAAANQARVRHGVETRGMASQLGDSALTWTTLHEESDAYSRLTFEQETRADAVAIRVTLAYSCHVFVTPSRASASFCELNRPQSETRK